VALVLVVAGFVLAGCGGGSSAKGGSAAKAGTETSTTAKVTTTTTAPTTTTTTAPTTTTTTAPTTTTTTAPKLEATPQTIAGTLTAVDLGGDWKTYAGKTKGKAGGSSACVGKDEPGKAASARSEGDILQKADQTRFVQTTTLGFPDATKAEAYVQSRLTNSWIECARSETEKGFKPPPKLTVETFSVKRATGQGTFRGQWSLDFVETVKGQQYSDGFVTHLYYRKGAIVIDAFLQQAPKAGDAKDLGKQAGDQVVAGMDKVLARVTG
jgi:hypothetical protein